MFSDALQLSFILGIVGAIVGSFIGAAVIRVPQGRGIITGRSHCDGCARPLSPGELIPILSYTLLRGRCRHCQTRIAIDQPIAELAGAFVGVLAAWSAQGLSATLMLSIFGWTLVALALLDARHFWLPDALTLPLIPLGLLGALILPQIALVERVVGAASGYLLLEALRLGYRCLRGREGLGAGDAKLLAAIGAWLGISALPWVLLVAAAAGFGWIGVRIIGDGPVSRNDRISLGTLLAIAAILIAPWAVGSQIF